MSVWELVVGYSASIDTYMFTGLFMSSAKSQFLSHFNYYYTVISGPLPLLDIAVYLPVLWSSFFY